MITFHLKPKEYVEGTEYDRLTEYDSVSVDDNGLEFYETDTDILWRVCAGAWLAINVGGGGGSTTFTGLTDTPASFAGAGGQLVAVNGAANALEFVDLPAHNIVGSSHTVVGSALDVVGLTSTNTLGLITPSSNPGATEKILKTAAGGVLTIRVLSTSVSLTVSGVLSLNGGGGALLHDSSGSPGVSGQFLKNVSTGQTDWANINITDLSGTGSQYDVVGFTASNTIGVLTPASDPAGANVVLLRTNTSGNINLQSGLTFNAAATISTTAGALTLQPLAGQSLMVLLSTTGDFIVNTSQLVVDTSTGRVGIGTAAPASIQEIVTGVISGTNKAPQLRMGITSGEYQGFYTTVANVFGMVGGAEYDGTNWTARHTSFALYSVAAVDGTHRWYTNTSLTVGNTFSPTERMRVGLGMQIGSPTGGDKGAGTINTAADIYKNNSAYTNPDYALEMWRDGRIVHFADNYGASTYRRLSLMEIKQYIVSNLRLPGFNDKPVGIFERGDLVLEKLEEIFTYLIDHEERLQDAEASLVV